MQSATTAFQMILLSALQSQAQRIRYCYGCHRCLKFAYRFNTLAPKFPLIHTERALHALYSPARKKRQYLCASSTCYWRRFCFVGLVSVVGHVSCGPGQYSGKLRAPLHTQRRASRPCARDPGPHTPDYSSYPCHLCDLIPPAT